MTNTPTGGSPEGGYPVYDPNAPAPTPEGASSSATGDATSTSGDPQAGATTSGSTASGAPASGAQGSAGSESTTSDSEPAPSPEEDLLARTRVSGTWVAIIIFAVILILLLIFVLQNTQSVEISYITADFKLPLAVAMLLSAVAGVLLTAIAGTSRILQLRRRVRKSQRS